jgi:hypothetical protein
VWGKFVWPLSQLGKGVKMHSHGHAFMLATLLGFGQANFVAQYTMYCEAGEVCDLPNPSASANDGTAVTPLETTYKVLPDGQKEEVSSGISSADFSKPATYLVEYHASGSTLTGNTPEPYTRSESVAIDVIVRDTKAPAIIICGPAVQHVDAFTQWTPCLTTTANDSVDGDLTSSMIEQIEKPDGSKIPFVQSNFESMTTNPGKYKILFDVSDHSGNAAHSDMVVYIVDNAAPVITVQGSQPFVNECTKTYQDAGATGWDREDGMMTACTVGQSKDCVNTFGGYVRSCKEIKESYPDSKSGMFDIDHPLKDDPDHVGPTTINVYCDMAADGGGYTYYPITDGISVRKITDANSCTALGMQMVIFRSEAQITNLFAKYGANYFHTAGGIFGTVDAVNKDLSEYPLNSEQSEVAAVFKANDEGKWFIKADKQTWTGEDYNPGCLLGLYGSNPILVRPASTNGGVQCGFETGTQYVCSTNDKGGSGVLGAPVPGLAANFPNTNKVGKYQVTYRAKDSAGNPASDQARVVEVRDTTPPVIKLKGQPMVIQHVAQEDAPFVLNDPGVTCTDTCDQAAAGCSAPTCEGDPERCRTKTDAESGSEMHSLACKAEASNDEVLTITWTKHLDIHKVGRYIRVYKCTDKSGNAASVSREFYLVAPTDPILTVVGEDPVTLEADQHKRYIDKGARCVDSDGRSINEKVYTMGQAVNQRVPGIYKIFYNCADHTGRSAEQASRTVIVEDNSCPTIKLKSRPYIIIEAGFNWVDPGAEAVDKTDGDLTSRIWKEGDTVDVSEAYYSRGSCAQILEDQKSRKGVEPKSGWYYITVTVEEHQKSKRVRVFCDMLTDGGGYTMYPVTGGIRTSRASDLDSCAHVGMQMVIPRTEGHFDAMLREFGTDYFQIVPGIIGSSDASMAGKAMKSTAWSDPSSTVPVVDNVWKATDKGDWYLRDTPFTEPSGSYTPGCWMSMLKWKQGDYHFAADDCDYSTNSYICSTNDKGGPSAVANNQLVNAYPSGAEKGKYVISYHVTDRSGNRECSSPKRTVVVKDTLAPVITVRIGDSVKVAGVLKDRLGNELTGSGMAQVQADEKAKLLAAQASGINVATDPNAAVVGSSGRRLLVSGSSISNSSSAVRLTVPLMAIAGTALVLAATVYRIQLHSKHQQQLPDPESV